MASTFRTGAIVTLVIFSLSACAGNSAAECELSGENLLKNTNFEERDRAGGPLHWAGIQHAGERSFELNIVDEILTINKIGTQPWYMLRQRISSEGLRGNKVAFTAEVKLNLKPPAIYQGFKVGGGLQITVKSNSSARNLLHSVFDHEPYMGSSEWQKIQVVFKMPKKAGMVELSLMQQADGFMSIRNPSFGLVSQKPKACAVTYKRPKS